MLFPFLISDKISLIKACPELAYEYCSLIDKNREYLKKTVPWIDNVKDVECQKRYFATVNQEILDKLLIKYEDRVVGEIHLQHYDRTKNEIEIGYWIDENYQGKGIVKQSAMAVLDYVFNELKVDRVNLYCNIENARSENLAKALGFEFRLIDKNHDNLYGRLIDSKLYVLSR